MLPSDGSRIVCRGTLAVATAGC